MYLAECVPYVTSGVCSDVAGLTPLLFPLFVSCSCYSVRLPLLNDLCITLFPSFISVVSFFFIFRPSFCFILLVVLPLICVSFSQFDPLFF